MRKGGYQINSSVKQLSAIQPGYQPQIEDEQYLKTLPKHCHSIAGEEQLISSLSKHQHALTGDQKQLPCKAREDYQANKRPERVGRQVKVSIIWLQGSLILGNLAVLFTSLVTLLAWYQLRQQHLVALAETVENQGVFVRAVEGGWHLEVGLVVTGLGLLLHWLVGGVVMPFRIGHCNGFALGAYLLFNVAAMLWQVCAALAIFHILPSFPSLSHLAPGTERFLSKWGAWLAASYISCLPVQLVSSALYLSFDDHQEVDEESVQLRRNLFKDGQVHATMKSEAVVGSERTSQDLSFYVTEMPAEQLKRKSQEPLSPFSRIRSESNNSTLPPSFRSVYLNSNRRFDDYSFNYDEYLDMEECWEESDQEGESIFCSGTTPPPPYSTLAIDV